jgi:RHS repeat-associated protein
MEMDIMKKVVSRINNGLRCYLSLMALASLLVVSQSALAVGGITADNESPYFSSNENREDFEDMRVKVLGGYVRMTRRWKGDRWEWNSRWNDLLTEQGLTIEEHADYLKKVEEDALQTGSVYIGESNRITPWLIRNGEAYRFIDKPLATAGQGLPLNREGTYESQQRFTIESDNGFTWKDKRGNSVFYNNLGKMQWYSNRNGVRVTLTRNSRGDIDTVKDHLGNVVITYHWEQAPEETDNEGNSLPIKYRLNKISDYSGREVIYSYDDANGGILANVVGVRGKTWTYQYSGKSLKSQTDPDGRVTQFGIDSEGNVQSRINADGVGVTYSYSYNNDKEEHYRSVRDTAGTVTESWFNEHGMVLREDVNGETQFTATVVLSDDSADVENLTKHYRVEISSVGGTEAILNQGEEPAYVKTRTVTDARGNKTVYTYDQFKNILKIERPDGSTVASQYNTNFSLPTRVTDERGITTTYAYDSRGNLLTIVEALGTAAERTTTYTYDSYGQRKSMTTGVSAAGNTVQATTEWFYDNYGNITKMVDPLDRETAYSNYDVLGNAFTLTDARTQVWQKTFDAAGNLLTDLNPLGQGETYTYSDAGDLKTITAANSSVTTITTNASGLPLTIRDAADAVTTLEYDKANRPTAIIDANQHSNQRSYDNQGRLKTLTDGENNTTEYRYADTLLASIHYPTYEEQLGYDNRNRLKDSTQKANNLSYLREYGYDVGNNLNSSTDANQQQEQYSYDALGRLTQVIDAKGGVTEFTYDARDNLLEVSDPEQRLTVYTYTLADELQTETKHDFVGTNKQRIYAYDANGNLETVTNPEQEKTLNAYDNANRLSKTEVFAHKDNTNPVKVITYNYNTNNQYEGYSQALGSDPTGLTPDVIALSESYTYNTLNQLESVTATFPLSGGGTFTKTYSYTYYPNGLKKTYTNPEGITYTYYYNKNNQIAAVHIPGKGQLAWTDFQWLVPQTLVLPGGNKITLSYDDFLRVEQRVLKDSANDDIASALYEYDLESNITKIGSEHGDYVFGYDELYRLTNADYPEQIAANDETFDYDGVGNRTSQTGSDPEGQTPESSTYNNHNQLEQKGSATFTYNDNGHTVTKIESGKVTEYVYNHEERLIAVKIDGAVVGEYSYNPYGQRVKKVAGGVTTWFLYNDEGMAAEYNAAGALVKEYHFKPYSTWMTEPLFQRTAEGEVYYYQNDHLGTPQRMVGVNGQVVWEARYSAFGEAEILTDVVGNNLRFPGQYFDWESGLHWNWMRDYDPEYGRYIQQDPVGILGGTNNYIYVYSRPVSLFDPYGLWAWGDPLPQWMVDGAAGFGDTLSFGLTDAIRDMAGWNDAVNKCSSAFNNGELGALGLSLAFGGAHLGRGAINQTTKMRSGLNRQFSDNRQWPSVQRTWSNNVGGYKGRYELHHWFTPRSKGGSNAGWNYMPVSPKLNNMMSDGGWLYNGFKASVLGLYGAIPTVAYNNMGDECEC